MSQQRYLPNLVETVRDPQGRLPVEEIFSSIQGEGRWAGYPAIFIRLAYCNLGCVWCDTRFTWDNDKIDHGTLLQIDEIVARVEAVTPCNSDRSNLHIVLTGGEPMLHHERLERLVSKLKNSGFDFFEIETNGTIIPCPAMCECISWWNCSPKLSNNGLSVDENLNVEAISAILQTEKADFKFVIRKREDIDELLATYGPHISADRIMLMAEGSTLAAQAAALPVVIEACREFGFRFSPRLHIMAWGNQRGK